MHKGKDQHIQFMDKTLYMSISNINLKDKQEILKNLIMK